MIANYNGNSVYAFMQQFGTTDIRTYMVIILPQLMLLVAVGDRNDQRNGTCPHCELKQTIGAM